MNNKYDFIIVNLKVISQIPRNRRLRMTTKGFFTLEDDHILVPVKRLIYGDSREKLIRDINFLLAEVYSQIKLLISSKHLEAEEDTEEKRLTLAQIAGIHRDLERSITGFENLKSTYESDKLMFGELELIIDKIRSHMTEVELKVPGVAEIISPVLIDKV